MLIRTVGSTFLSVCYLLFLGPLEDMTSINWKDFDGRQIQRHRELNDHHLLNEMDIFVLIIKFIAQTWHKGAVSI